jgi:3-hydroxy-9,10-secoandrosta-1,3,5(10)-triene-9,17-dione monooxygenase reductase component
MPALTPEPDRFRQVLGHFCTGVTVITTVDATGPAGFTCQSFAAVSLDPPLVLFCPSRSSATWRRIERAGHFCANVLADEQRELARVFAGSGPAKFDGVGWSPAPSGAPLLDGAVAWVGAEIETVQEAGDHYVVIGRVTGLSADRPGPPLLFYRGRYAVTAPGTGDGPPEVVDTLLAWPRHADWI